MNGESQPLRYVMLAADFAARKHRNQRRKNAEKTPYINHPIGVAHTLAEVGVTDADVLAAALLHDTIEDTECTWEELNALFTETTVAYVREVTDDKTLSKAERKRLQVEHASHASLGARLVKVSVIDLRSRFRKNLTALPQMSDKLYNMRSLFDDPPTWWDWKRIQGYCVWSKAVTNAAYQPTLDKPQPQDRLHALLDEVYNSQFEFQGQIYDCIPQDVNEEEVLEEYYASMEEAGKVESD